MTEEEAIERLEDLLDMEDTERSHYLADKILIAFLNELGYNEIVDLWKKVDKEYG